MKTTIKKWTALFAIAIVGILSGCSPDETDSGNGLGDPNVDATFTVSEVNGSPNRLRLNSQPGVLRSQWKIGNGQPYFGDVNEIVFFPDAGTYEVTHTAYGRGGLSNTTTQSITVATGDPEAGNRLSNPDFSNGSASWNVLNISASGAAWTFGSEGASVTASGFSQQAIYQAVEVEAGKHYKADLTFSGTGSVDTWFELYVSQTPPVQGSDYTGGGILLQLNTWNGCGGSPFTDQVLSSFSCGSTQGGEVTFATSGTAYFVIKCGGGNTGTITVTNTEFRKLPD